MSMFRTLLAATFLALPVTAHSQGESQTWSNSFPDSRLGASIAVIGDTNGDGIHDFVVGAPDDSYFAPCRAGRAFLVDGASGTTRFTVYGDVAGNALGSQVAAAGDVNGDAIPDFLTAAPRAPYVGTQPGTVRVHSGADGAVLRAVGPSDPFAPFGSALAGGSDIDGDAVPDFFVATSLHFPAGSPVTRVTAFSGATGALLYELTNPIGAAETLELEFVGDLDGDGRHDLAIGSYGADVAGTNSGHVLVVSGASGAPILNVPGNDSFDWFGYSLASTGDISGDGVPDFAVGAPNDEIGAPSAGSVSLVSGADGARLWTAAGSFPSQRFGVSLARIDDLNVDGIPDVACGAWESLFHVAGTIEFCDGLTGASLSTLHGTDAAPIAEQLAGSPDTDGDGIGEVLSGVPWSMNLDNGRVSRIAPTPVATTTTHDIEGTITHYGAAILDSTGHAPWLVASGTTAPGGSLRLEVTNAIGGQPAAVLVGPTELGSKISVNGAALLTPPAAILITTLSGTGAGNGSLVWNVTVPAIPLPPLVHLQVLCGDPGSPLGFTPTRAARLKF